MLNTVRESGGIFHKDESIERSGYNTEKYFISTAEKKLKNKYPGGYAFVNLILSRSFDSDIELFNSLKKEIINRYNRGFELIDIEYGNEIWFAVFQKNKNI
ncbi:MAG: hypothetical protein FXF47_09075 [Candidatus Mcinerneyibacterium aminivorans]|jgi:hypothetical protein|uniref:Uncharacterized protein n=1 Tax=Candidatus Mcinerneyibacterium aminivorans TaxID=2703815 RepID=A0A5D0MF01_9BACT|nr:MAG: hypothetical protein FXF47_09075 [Candidatus Mcinerneyibacterium aminivorans]